MKIIISNTVALNGGDFAILNALIKGLKSKYGEATEILIYDMHADVARHYYPGLNFRPSLYQTYKKVSLSRKSGLFGRAFRKYVPVERPIFAAKLFSLGSDRFSKLLLNKEEKVDFYHYRTADLVISTGGTYLVENYSLKARIFDYKFTLALNKPLIFFTQSLGPFKNKENQRMLSKIFNKADLILLRDKKSLNSLKEIKVNTRRSHVCSDVVFTEASSAILEQAKRKEIFTPLKVGISVRYWKFFKGRSTQEGKDKYFKSIAAICEHIVRNLRGEVEFISTCQAIEEYHVDDSKAAREIYELLSQQTKAKVSVNAEFHTPDQLKLILKEFSVVISTRMHGAIESLNVGVPVLPVAYEFKTIELFKKLIPERLILDIDKMEENHSVQVFDEFLEMMPKFKDALWNNVLKEHHSSLEAFDYLRDRY